MQSPISSSSPIPVHVYKVLPTGVSKVDTFRKEDTKRSSSKDSKSQFTKRNGNNNDLELRDSYFSNNGPGPNPYLLPLE